MDAHVAKPSTTDLTSCSNSLLPRLHVSKLANRASVHLPVEILLGEVLSTFKLMRRSYWKCAQVMWVHWREDLSRVVSFQEDTLEGWPAGFCEDIIRASNCHPARANHSFHSRYNKLWWMEDCKHDVVLHRKSKKTMMKHSTLENILEYRRLTAKVKHVVRTAQKSAWERYCSTTTMETPPGRV